MKFDADAFYERLYSFAVDCHKLSLKLPKNAYNNTYNNQLIRASASIGANYIEAVDGFSKKDFLHRLRISRKETRESVHWLRLINDTNALGIEVQEEVKKLITEAGELKKIFTSSILTTEQKMKSSIH